MIYTSVHGYSECMLITGLSFTFVSSHSILIALRCAANDHMMFAACSPDINDESFFFATFQTPKLQIASVSVLQQTALLSPPDLTNDTIVFVCRQASCIMWSY